MRKTIQKKDSNIRSIKKKKCLENVVNNTDEETNNLNNSCSCKNLKQFLECWIINDKKVYPEPIEFRIFDVVQFCKILQEHGLYFQEIDEKYFKYLSLPQSKEIYKANERFCETLSLTHIQEIMHIFYNNCWDNIGFNEKCVYNAISAIYKALGSHHVHFRQLTELHDLLNEDDALFKKSSIRKNMFPSENHLTNFSSKWLIRKFDRLLERGTLDRKNEKHWNIINCGILLFHEKTLSVLKKLSDYNGAKVKNNNCLDYFIKYSTRPYGVNLQFKTNFCGNKKIEIKEEHFKELKKELFKNCKDKYCNIEQNLSIENIRKLNINLYYKRNCENKSRFWFSKVAMNRRAHRLATEFKNDLNTEMLEAC